jgi:hypothetical protein
MSAKPRTKLQRQVSEAMPRGGRFDWAWLVSRAYELAGDIRAVERLNESVLKSLHAQCGDHTSGHDIIDRLNDWQAAWHLALHEAARWRRKVDDWRAMARAKRLATLLRPDRQCYEARPGS